MQDFRVGKEVRLNTPDNKYLHGEIGVIKEITDYGGIVTTMVGSGEFRALYGEMIIEKELAQTNGVYIKKEYSGNCCQDCGSTKIQRTGSCETCQECGRSSGCV